MKVSVKIFGERNTGTNYLRKLIEENLEVTLLKGSISKGSIFTLREWTKDLFFILTKGKNLGWKHAKVDADLLKGNLYKPFIITLTKNPYSFLLSLYNRPYHYKGSGEFSSFSDFLNSEWGLRRRDNIQQVESLDTPIELWNIKNRSYMEFAKNNDNIIQIRYEDLLKDPSKIMNNISEKIDLPLKESFSNHYDSTKEDNKRFSDYQYYYLTEKWKDKICDKEVALINSKLDNKVVDYFGYELY